jgi:hypothetical protein
MAPDSRKSLQGQVGVDAKAANVKIVREIPLLAELELAFETDNRVNETFSPGKGPRTVSDMRA